MPLTGSRRKRIRLDAPLYADPSAICSVTITTARRKPVFGNRDVAAASAVLLERRAAGDDVLVHAFCFMSDHVHLLLSPSARTSLIDFVRDFKGETTKLAWKHGYHGQVWQRSFFDHFLRRDEDVERAVRYILHNPVRAGLVAEPSQYDFCGPPMQVPGGRLDTSS